MQYSESTHLIAKAQTGQRRIKNKTWYVPYAIITIQTEVELVGTDETTRVVLG